MTARELFNLLGDLPESAREKEVKIHVFVDYDLAGGDVVEPAKDIQEWDHAVLITCETRQN